MAIVAVVGVVSSASIAAIAVNSLASEVQANTVDLGNEGDVQQLVDVGAIEGGVNVLIVGSDTRIDQLATPGDDTDGARNDVTMLMHISQDHQNVSVISFPRDTMIDMPECTDQGDGEVKPAQNYQQLNTALGKGGLPCVVSAVQQITGLKIPYAGVIAFDGVAAMTSVVGGVDVCVSQPINDPYSQLSLSAGVHTLSGTDALAFLRTREGVGDGSDLARISSQQVYLSALVRKLLSSDTLTNPVTLYGIARSALTNMQFSTQLASVDSMVSIAKALQGVQLDKVAFLRYPVVEDPDDPNRVVVNDADSEILNAALANDTPLDLSKVATADSATSADGTGDAPATDPATDPAADPAADPSATATPDAGGATVLPDSFTGQTAAEVTCSVGN